jgi:hypothetical protein
MTCSSLPWWRIAPRAGLLGLTLLSAVGGTGCLEAPAPDLTYDRQSNAMEVYRVFCRRVAKSAYPTDATGDRFYEVCDEGKPEDEDNKDLKQLLRYRPQIIASLDRALGDDGVAEGDTFADGELGGFLNALVPLYDKPNETVPTATRGIAQLLEQLVDENDQRANKVLDTVERLVKRKGYRSPAMNLGAVRALFTYPGLDTLAQTLLPVLTAEGAAHDEFVAVLSAAALELADDPVPVADLDNTTLHEALGILLREDPAQKSGNLNPVPVLLREKGTGNALPADGAGGSLPTPFAVSGEQDTARDGERDPDTTLATGAYQTLDASQTLLAALMRETSLLIARGENERSPLENFAHGLKPLLGKRVARTETIGKNVYSFEGPDVDKSPLMDLAHAGAILLRYPETETLIKVLDKLIHEHENEATGFDYAAMAIADMAKESKYDDAKLNGPHELWDDLIAVAERMNMRQGLFEGLIRSFTDPKAGAQGALFASWMRYNDEISYPNSPSTDPEDINKAVTQKYEQLVDRGSPDVGMNRSIWQRTMSLINALNGVKVCNKAGGTLTATTGIGVLSFPFGDVAGAGYKECELIEIQDAVEIYSRSAIGVGQVAIKDAFATVLSVIGDLTTISGSVGEIQETESQIKGFTDKPTPGSLARFIFAPRNKWITDLFVPQQTREGFPIAEYEPNALFPLEVVDDKTPVAGKASSFLEVGQPLLKAFDDAELRDPLTKLLTDGYMFGHTLSVVHKHWGSKKSGGCPAMVEKGNEGCTQSDDPAAALYAPGTGIVSYEELIADAVDDQDFVYLLHKAAIVLQDIKVQTPDGATVDGIKALADFVKVAVTPNPMLKKRDGSTSSKSTLCQEAGGACTNGVGRVIPVLSPMVMLGDALQRMDQAFEGDKERQDIWHEGRSGLLDQILSVDRTGTRGSYTFKLRDRTAYNISNLVLPWVSELLDKHRAAQDLDAWAFGLSDRAAKILRHPLAGAVVDLLDAFWPEKEASGEFTAVTSFLTDEENKSAYTGLLTAIADTAILLDRDSDLGPAIQFAALGLAPNAFKAIEGTEAPKGDKGVAYAALELTGGVVQELKKTQKGDEKTALSKLLNNVVLSDGADRTPLEVLLDATADVNREDPNAQPTTPLTAAEDREVFKKVKAFLYDDSEEQRSLERLYSVIQGRKASK